MSKPLLREGESTHVINNEGDLINVTQTNSFASAGGEQSLALIMKRTLKVKCKFNGGWIVFCLVALWWCVASGAQSCGPRVSARLLAEIPCDMRASGYCGSPGSAYPWNSVKRYISDNQGLVRRMYGDENHSAVLLGEIDLEFGGRHDPFLRQHPRTQYGRSAKSPRRSPSRRQPRPQIFEDDADDPATSTVFRVVTETSIKVGEAATSPGDRATAVAYEPASEYDEPDSRTTETGTTEASQYTQQEETLSTDSVTSTTTSSPTTAEVTTVDDFTTAGATHAAPVALHRVGYEELADKEEQPRKTGAASLLNSVEDKLEQKQSHKQQQIGKDDRTSYKEAAEGHGAAVEKDSVDEGPNRKQGVEGEEEEPKRGINACPVKNEVIAPYWANNTRGETLALLNVHPFEQYVHFEKCAFENHQMLCRDGCRCEQQYRLHRLLAFDPKNECRGIFSDWFRFPSCCVCVCYHLTPDGPRRL